MYEKVKHLFVRYFANTKFLEEFTYVYFLGYQEILVRLVGSR